MQALANKYRKLNRNIDKMNNVTVQFQISASFYAYSFQNLYTYYNSIFFVWSDSCEQKEKTPSLFKKYLPVKSWNW